MEYTRVIVKPAVKLLHAIKSTQLCLGTCTSRLAAHARCVYKPVPKLPLSTDDISYFTGTTLSAVSKPHATIHDITECITFVEYVSAWLLNYRHPDTQGRFIYFESTIHNMMRSIRANIIALATPLTHMFDLAAYSTVDLYATTKSSEMYTNFSTISKRTELLKLHHSVVGFMVVTLSDDVDNTLSTYYECTSNILDSCVELIELMKSMQSSSKFNNYRLYIHSKIYNESTDIGKIIIDNFTNRNHIRSYSTHSSLLNLSDTKLEDDGDIL